MHRKGSQRDAVPNTEDTTMKSLNTKLALSALGIALIQRVTFTAKRRETQSK
jgi:hypothetical protein